MKELFTYLCEFSVVTSVAILLAILLRPILKKGPAFIRCILWALVFLRLLLPVGFAELPFSTPSLFNSAEEAVSLPQDEGKPAGDSVVNNATVQEPSVQTPAVQTPATDTIPNEGNNVSAPVMDQNLPQGENAPQAEREIDILFALSAVWAAGVIAMLGYMLASNLLLGYRVRGAIVYDSRIRIINKDCSPFVFGFFRPIIYIPASASKKDWPHIIAHETAHIKRFDHVLKPLAFFVLCFYWFNPLVWAAYILLGKDIEYACDERTVKRMESNDRKAYSLALLAVSQGGNIVFAPPLSFGKVSVKERVKRVMTRKIPVWAVCLAIVICALLTFLTAFTLAAAESADADGGDISSAGAEASDVLEEGGNSAEATLRTYLLPSVIRKSGYTLYIQYEDGGLTIRSDGDFYYRYTWDAQGRLTGEHFSWCNFLYEYDADGLLTLELQKDRYGKEIMRTEYTYNEQGECVDAKVTASPERWESRQEHTYDAAGNLVTEIQYTDGTVEAWRLEYKYDGNGNMVQKLQYSDSGDRRTFYEYDKNGKLIKETSEDLEGDLVYYCLYAYDENGLCREKDTFLPDIDAIITSELRETVEVTLSEDAYKTVLKLLLAHY